MIILTQRHWIGLQKVENGRGSVWGIKNVLETDILKSQFLYRENVT